MQLVYGVLGPSIPLQCCAITPVQHCGSFPLLLFLFLFESVREILALTKDMENAFYISV